MQEVDSILKINSAYKKRFSSLDIAKTEQSRTDALTFRVECTDPDPSKQENGGKNPENSQGNSLPGQHGK